ncbi:MAG: hypothetical protein KGS72_01815 [Cyanobacteria bacterium REEB67]|nr:hypothetical protein [Cyanobacteria bacterium REEB67]
MGMDHTAATAQNDVRDAGKLEQTHNHAAGNADNALGKLQESADLFPGAKQVARNDGRSSDKFDQLYPGGANEGKGGTGLENGDLQGKGSDHSFLPHRPLDMAAPPTDEERSDADKSLDKSLSKMAAPEASKSMQAIDAAITSGDTKALGEAIKSADPAKLRDMLGEINRVLAEKGSSTRLDMTEDGKVLVSDSKSNTAIAVDPKTGDISAKEVEHNADGSMLVKPGELLNVDTDKAFKEISDRTVNAVNGKVDFGDILQKMDDKHVIFDHSDDLWGGTGGGTGGGSPSQGGDFVNTPRDLDFTPLKEY